MRRFLPADIDEFDSIPERVVHLQTAGSRQVLVPPPGCPKGVELPNEGIEVVDNERWMRLASRAKVVFDTQMHLNVARREPAAAARCEGLWFRKDSEAEDTAAEGFRLSLPSSRHGELNVIEGDNSRWHPLILPAGLSASPNPKSVCRSPSVLTAGNEIAPTAGEVGQVCGVQPAADRGWSARER